MSPAEALLKGALAQRVRDALDATSGGPPSAMFWAPGRIEFLGKHTDYAGGRSLVCAVERGIVIAARPRTDRAIRMLDAARGGMAEFPLDVSAEAPDGHWSNYPATVARRIARNFPTASRGADIAFASDLPIASGMSSSSALVVATFLALAHVNDLEQTREYREAIHSDEDLAAYLGTVENGMTFGALAGEAGVGTFGGSEDHAAIVCATPGALTEFSFCPLRTERVVALPRDHVFAVASSGVVAEKTGAALESYNAVSHLAREALEWLRRDRDVNYPTLAAAVDDAPAHGGLGDMPEPVRSRAEQFARESTLHVPSAAAALERGDLSALARIVDESQHDAEMLLHNQVPETIFLAARARELGAVAASAFGAGFGGSVWALVATADADAFMDAWRDVYARRFPARGRTHIFFRAHAGPHVRVIDLH